MTPHIAKKTSVRPMASNRGLLACGWRSGVLTRAPPHRCGTLAAADKRGWKVSGPGRTNQENGFQCGPRTAVIACPPQTPDTARAGLSDAGPKTTVGSIGARRSAQAGADVNQVAPATRRSRHE